MYIPFENLPEESRIWIYQSNRKLSDVEVAEIEAETKNFIEDWSAHGTNLESSFLVKYNRFIIFAVNTTTHSVSGCSIDASVVFIQSLEQKYQIDLLDKMNVTFKNGEFIAYKSLIEFKKMAKDKAVTANTIVFNNLINTIQEFNDSWEVHAEDSWHSRFF